MRKINKLLSAFAVATVAGMSGASAGGDLNEYRPVIWSGFYAGIQAGYADAKYDGVFDNRGNEGFAEDLDLSGGTAGIHIGYNWQHSNIVLGIEADISAVNISDAVSDRSGGQDDITAGNIDTLASLRGRIGVTSGTFMVYATGGIAFADAEYTVVDTDTDQSSGTASFDTVGYVVGGGLEKMFAQSGIRVRVEGLYYGFDDKIDTSNLAPTDSDAGDFAKFEDIWSVRVGLSVPLGSK
ncbi:MAG: outer membrane protein [Methyloligellaceae bacterium]